MNRKIIIASIIIIALLLGGLLLIKIFMQNQTINSLQQSFDTLEVNHEALKQAFENIKQQHTDLQQKYDSLQSDYGELDVSMQKTEVRVDKAVDKLRDFEITVKESMEWFTENNNLKNAERFTDVKPQLVDECVDTEKGCYINLDCINDVNRRCDISYETDKETTGSSDFLKTLDQIHEDKGGDCEDFSLLFTAEYNYLVDHCIEQGIPKENITALYDKREVSNWYMYPVCGVFDPQRMVSGFSGHCVVALVKSPITRSAHVYTRLKDAILVEPQSGDFMFNLNDTDVIELFNVGQPPDTLYHLYFVITPDDLKIFYEYSEEIGWTGYADFLEEVNLLKGRIKI